MKGLILGSATSISKEVNKTGFLYTTDGDLVFASKSQFGDANGYFIWLYLTGRDLMQSRQVYFSGLGAIEAPPYISCGNISFEMQLDGKIIEEFENRAAPGSLILRPDGNLIAGKVEKQSQPSLVDLAKHQSKHAIEGGGPRGWIATDWTLRLRQGEHIVLEHSFKADGDYR